MFQNIKNKLTKYRINQILFGLNCFSFLSFWFFLWQNSNFLELSFESFLTNFNFFRFWNFFDWNLIWTNLTNFDIFLPKLQILSSNLILFLQFFGFFLLIIIGMLFNLHYFMNLVHLSSHRLLSKNKVINSILGNLSAIFCGLTLADFASTHLIHHSFLHTEKDPDRMIARAPHFLVLPFFIFWHDLWFWQNNLWQNNRFIGYLTDRIIQICLVLLFWYFGKLNLWLIFWLLPIYLVGFFNGMFLFYFPHFQTNWEKKKRLINNYQTSIKTEKLKPKSEFNEFENNFTENFEKIEIKTQIKNHKIKLDYFDQLGLFIIDLSRYSHALHHEKIHSNWAYFPIITKIFKPEMLIITDKFVKNNEP